MSHWGSVVAASLLSLGCGAQDPPVQAHDAEGGSGRNPTPAVAGGFDGTRAFEDLVDQVRIGPRHPHSPGAERTRELIRQRLRQAGWPVRDQEFVAQPPTGPAVAMTNVIGLRKGEREELVLLGAHYDTKQIPGVRFVGANDGASGTALLLEVARQLAAQPLPFDVWLVFFDGEEAFGKDITRDDGLYGSRFLASQMEADGTLERVAAMIVVDMVADADLNLAVDLNSSPALRRVLRDSAERIGMASLIDASAPLRVTDDHTPFLRRGVTEVLAVIDFQYGARSSPGPVWHTSGDDLDKVSAGSLNSVGRLLVETLHGVERHLVEAERARDR